MMPMQLGSVLYSPKRWQLQRLAMFAVWHDDAAVDAVLDATRLGRVLAGGWHVRLKFLRRWGHVVGLDAPNVADETNLDAPVVAVTVARMKLLQVPRFIRWGLPVERLVRDHPGTTFALAAMRPWRTISTFTVWNSAREMLDMVHGNSADERPGSAGGIDAPDRHAVAMVERERKDFHREFTTLRFTCTREVGEWEGRTRFVPMR